MLHLFSKIFALFLTVAVLFSSSTVFAADATKAAPQPSPAKTSILPQSADFNTVTTQIEKNPQKPGKTVCF